MQEARRPAIQPKAPQLQAAPYVEYPRQPESAGEQLCAIMQKHYAPVFTLRSNLFDRSDTAFRLLTRR